MHNEKTELKKFFGLIIILLPLLIIPTILSGGEADKNPERIPEIQADYVLTVKGDHISLKAKDASLKDIIEEIGRRMNIDVVANIPREEKITIELDMMYLGDAIKRFRTNYAYITESEKDKGKITKIVVVPEGMEKMLPNKSEYNAQPSVQNFEYNPQPPIQNFEREPRPSHVESEYDPQSSIQKNEIKEKKRRIEPESRARKEVGTEEPSIPEPLKEEPSTPEPLKFEYDPQPYIQE